MSYTSSPAHLQLCRQDDLPIHYPPFSESSDRFADSAVGEPRTALYPTLSSQLHPRRIFTRQNSEGNTRPLNPHLFTPHHHQIYQSSQSFTNVPPHHQWPLESQSWSPQYHSVPVSLKQADGHLHYPPFSTPPPFPQSRPPPSTLHQPKRTSSGGGLTSPGNRLAFTETVDPTTGLLLRTPEHPRLRTAQACQKCRLRKAKCSGEHPTCERCVTRGLVCEYAKEGRVRGPNKPKGKSSSNPGGSEASTGNDNATSRHNGRPGTRTRTSSATSSTGSSDTIDFSPVGHSLVATDLELDSKATGEVICRSRRGSLSVDNSTPAQTRRLGIVSEPRGFRRPVTAIHGSMFSADSDYCFLPSEMTSGSGAQPEVDHQFQHHYDTRRSGNSLIMQENSGISSSGVTIRRIHRESASVHLPTDHSLPFGISHSEFIPIGLNEGSGMQPDSIKSQDMMFQAVSCHQQQDDVSGSFSGCGSPGTASSISSPLTPNAAPTLMSLRPNILHNIPHIPSQETKFNSSSELTFHFGFEHALAPPSSTTHGHSQIRAEQENTYGYHSPMDISIC